MQKLTLAQLEWLLTPPFSGDRYPVAVVDYTPIVVISFKHNELDQTVRLRGVLAPRSGEPEQMECDVPMTQLMACRDGFGLYETNRQEYLNLLEYRRTIAVSGNQFNGWVRMGQEPAPRRSDPQELLQRMNRAHSDQERQAWLEGDFSSEPARIVSTGQSHLTLNNNQYHNNRGYDMVDPHNRTLIQTHHAARNEAKLQEFYNDRLGEPYLPADPVAPRGRRRITRLKKPDLQAQNTNPKPPVASSLDPGV